MNKIFTFFVITFISSTIFSDDVLNETVYWELTRVDAKIEEKKYDEAEDILRYWYKKNWRSRSYNKAVIARTYGFFLFQRERFEEALEKPKPGTGTYTIDMGDPAATQTWPPTRMEFNMKDEMARQKIDNIIKELDELKEELKELKK